MRKIKEVLRLKWDLGLAARQIAHSLSISHSTVLGMLHRAEQAGCGATPPPPSRRADAGRFRWPHRAVAVTTANSLRSMPPSTPRLWARGPG
jgi:hypothetical protein